MSFKDIAAVVLSAEADEAAIAAAETIAETSDADLAVVLVEERPEPVYAADGLGVGAVWPEILAQAHADFLKVKEKLVARCQRSTRRIAIEEVVAGTSMAGIMMATRARHADLTILSRPDGGFSDFRMSLFEAALFNSGRPVLLVPPQWRKGPIGSNVVVAWNAKREAARALADAAPFLDRAAKITVLTVDAKPGLDGHGEAPGVDIAAHLARRGLKVEVLNADALGRSDSIAVLEEAQGLGADLMVMGGYGHARLRQFFFGGVTRDLVMTAPIPLLMSH